MRRKESLEGFTYKATKVAGIEVLAVSFEKLVDGRMFRHKDSSTEQPVFVGPMDARGVSSHDLVAFFRIVGSGLRRRGVVQVTALDWAHCLDRSLGGLFSTNEEYTTPIGCTDMGKITCGIDTTNDPKLAYVRLNKGSIGRDLRVNSDLELIFQDLREVLGEQLFTQGPRLFAGWESKEIMHDPSTEQPRTINFVVPVVK